jgi:hypothetical protein
MKVVLWEQRTRRKKTCGICGMLYRPGQEVCIHYSPYFDIHHGVSTYHHQCYIDFLLNKGGESSMPRLDVREALRIVIVCFEKLSTQSGIDLKKELAEIERNLG